MVGHGTKSSSLEATLGFGGKDTPSSRGMTSMPCKTDTISTHWRKLAEVMA
jgi:hypothetical protein